MLSRLRHDIITIEMAWIALTFMKIAFDICKSEIIILIFRDSGKKAGHLSKLTQKCIDAI